VGYGEDEAMSSLHVQDFTDSGCNALMTIVTDVQGSSEEVRDLTFETYSSLEDA